MYRNIVTHSDLDGIGSAAMCSWAFGVNRILFTGPADIQSSRFAITEEDIVCDLPCPTACGLWFDHHVGNQSDLEHRGVDPTRIPGSFSADKSCGRVVWNYLAARDRQPPAHFGALADALDVVDSFDYATIEEWRAETPAHVVENAMKVPFSDYRLRNQFFRNVVYHLRDFGLERTARMPEVRRYHEAYRAHETKMLQLIQQDAKPLDEDGELLVLDLTRHNQKPFVWKNLAQVLFAEPRAVVSVEAGFREGRKTNDLAFSMSLTIRQNRSGAPKDVGEIMRTLNIGDGHPGAGGGRISCRSKDEMLRAKDETLRKIAELWRAQGKEAGK